jgi:hypothetical protein
VNGELRTDGDAPLPGGDFRLLVQKMAYQALIALGVVDNPLTGARRTNAAGARAVLADLELLQDKTAGNLSPAEAEHLDGVLRGLERHFEAVEALHET